MRRTVMAVGAVLALAACGHSSNGSASEAKGAEIGVAAHGADRVGNDPAAVGAGVALGRSVVRTAALTVRVDDVDAARRTAVAAAERAGGYLEAERTGLDATTLTLRVAPESFTAALDTVAQLGDVASREISTQDVTGDVADVQGRLAAARASAARLRGLLAQAATVSDVASLESELSDRESDIESLATRQRSLAGQTALATITATLRRTVPPPPKVAAAGFAGGLRGGWRAFVGVVAVALLVAGAVAPFAGVALLAGAPVWWVRRRRRASAIV